MRNKTLTHKEYRELMDEIKHSRNNADIQELELLEKHLEIEELSEKIDVIYSSNLWQRIVNKRV